MNFIAIIQHGKAIVSEEVNELFDTISDAKDKTFVYIIKKLKKDYSSIMNCVSVSREKFPTTTFW